MFITKKKHRKEYLEMSGQYQLQIGRLEEELRAARDLKSVLEKLASSHTCFSNSFGISGDLQLPGDVARFVPDHFGGQVIKQEATSVIQIEPNGSITIGLTKRPPDAGFSYILIRKPTAEPQN